LDIIIYIYRTLNIEKRKASIKTEGQGKGRKAKIHDDSQGLGEEWGQLLEICLDGKEPIYDALGLQKKLWETGRNWQSSDLGSWPGGLNV
jgi:hypothetical protein